MRLTVGATLALMASLVGLGVSAQQVGDNINVLPVFQGIDQNDFLRGDLYGQRQVEPSIVVSSLNKDHMMAFYIDFRTVDVPGGPLPPEGRGNSGFASRLWNGTRSLFARLLGGSAPRGKGAPVAALQAGIGMSVSYDGGLTWTGGFMPGLPFDPSPASINSPGFPLEAMSDPTAIAAPCGRFYVAYMHYSPATRLNKMLVAMFQDQNDHDVRHTVRYLGTRVLATGMNDTNGHFLDKADIGLRLTGATSCSQVTEEVFVTYTTFTGQGSASNFQSKVNLSRSTDQGQTWSSLKVDDNYTDSQGTVVVTNPVTGQVIVFFRSFNSPNTMVMRRSTTSGSFGFSKPVDLLANDPLKTLAVFDQRSVSTQDLPIGPTIRNELAFRTNAFPAAAFTPDGSTLIAVWQERVNASSGLPDPSGSPKIVWKYSKDGGTVWSERRALALNRAASPPGLGFFNPSAGASGPQVMPSIACGAGAPNRCVVTFYESRQPGLAPNGLIAGYDQLLDLRAVLIDAPPGPNSPPTPQPSFQVSRYSFRPLLENETPQETLDYVQPNCRPDGTNCRAALGWGNEPLYAGGTTAFNSDYSDISAIEQYVKDPVSGAWRLARTAADVPGGARFIAAFADTRNVHQPFENFNNQPLQPGTEWQSYSIYGPAGLGGSCLNPLSRDQNVNTAHISTGMLVTAPTNFKPFQSPLIEFPMTIWNNTAVDRQFDLRLVGNGSFAKEASSEQPPAYAFPLKDGGVTVFPYSSVSVNVYALDGAPVTVTATECTVNGCAPVATPLTGSITFNATQAAPPGGTPQFTYTSSDIVVNPVPRNPVPRNPVPRNPVPRNPVPRNAITGEPVPVYDIIDYSWTVNPSSQDDAGTYLALANIDRAYQNDYVFQVFVTKPSTQYTTVNCQPGNSNLGTLVGHISDPANPVPRNPVPRNPVPRNPVPRNATLSDQLVSNTTFTLESSETVSPSAAMSGFSALSVSGLGCNPTTGAGLIGECTMAAPRPPNETTITVRAYQITQTPSVIFDPHGNITNNATPPSITVADYWCTSAAQGCPFAQDGPDLAVPDPPANPATNVTPTTVRAGQSVTFPVTPATVPNVGNRPAKEHRVGYYISAATTIATLPRRSDGALDTSSSTYTRLLQSVDKPVLNPGFSETVDSQSLTIPPDIPRPNNGQGTYFLYAFVDDLRRVNELNEDNNIIQGGPITVLSPGYVGIIGLFSPCSGLSCAKSAGSAMPLAFQFTLDGTTAANSQSTKPRFRVYAPGPGGACVTNVPANGSGYLFLADEDNISSGSSLWQYFATAGTRPAFTWQYNFQGKNPTTGTTLAPGCYSFFLEVPAFGQTVGSAVGPVTRLSITLQ